MYFYRLFFIALITGILSINSHARAQTNTESIGIVSLINNIGSAEDDSRESILTCRMKVYSEKNKDPKDRMDLSAEIGGSFNYSISSPVTLTISLGREQNFSNFNEFEYTNYHAANSLVYKF